MGLAFDTAQVLDADFYLGNVDTAPIAAGNMLVLAKHEVGGVDLVVRLLDGGVEERGGNFDCGRLAGLVGCLFSQLELRWYTDRTYSKGSQSKDCKQEGHEGMHGDGS